MSIFAEAAVELPNDTDVVVRRSFAAPPELVFAAHTRPALLKRWLLGPDGWSMPVCEVEPFVGGKYRYRWRNDESGSEFGFFGVCEEYVENQRMVQIEQMEGDDTGTKVRNTATFEAVDGGTLLTITLQYPSTEVREMILGTGMTDGMETSYKRLEAVLASESPGAEA